MVWGETNRYRTVVRGALVLALLGPAACRGDGDKVFKRPEVRAATTTTTTTTVAAPPAPMELLWATQDVRYASRPVLAGGRAIAFVAEAGGLTLVAYDPTTGEEVWRRESTASAITQGVAFDVAADEERVFHLAPTSGGSAAVEAVDAVTGNPVWTSREAPQGFVDGIDHCDETMTSLCVGALNESGDVVQWELLPDSGEVTEQPDAGGRAIGPHLYDLFDSGNIARMTDGQVTWQRSPSELFNGAAVSPNFGWYWREFGGLLIGTLGTEHEQVDNGTVELPPEQIAGIDAASGETRWVTPGDPFCGRVADLTFTAADESDQEGDHIWVRCHTTGTVTVQDGEWSSYVLNNVMEGFDPLTGATTWSVDLGASSALWDDTRLFLRLGPKRFALVRDDGSLVGLDLVTGESLGVGPDLVGWCMSENRYDYTANYEVPGRIGEDFTAPCNLAGVPQPAPYEPDPGIGVVTADIFVWMDETGLHGARIN